MENPNGYGSIDKLSGKRRRNPWAVRITTSLENGTQRREYILVIIKQSERHKRLWQSIIQSRFQPIVMSHLLNYTMNTYVHVDTELLIDNPTKV